MKVRPAKPLLLCLALTAAGANLAFCAVRGEPIRFSQPAIPIAVELKEDQQLPVARDRKPDFGSSSIQQPAAVQPMVVRTQPQEKEKKKNVGTHWLLDDPKDFPDATGRANAREKRANGSTRSRESSMRERNSNPSESSDDDSALERSEKAGALSPISDFHWDARRGGDSRSNSWSGTGRKGSEKKETSNSNPFGLSFSRDESSEKNRDSGSSFFSDLFAARSKEGKPTEAQLEHRAAFERLLNHNTTSATGTGGSLEPVTTVENPKAAALPAAMPTVASPRLDVRPMEPMEAFNQRQAQLRPPTAIDFNKKANHSAPAMPASTGASSDSPFQTPLMRQPTIREMPTRKF